MHGLIERHVRACQHTSRTEGKSSAHTLLDAVSSWKWCEHPDVTKCTHILALCSASTAYAEQKNVKLVLHVAARKRTAGALSLECTVKFLLR